MQEWSSIFIIDFKKRIIQKLFNVKMHFLRLLFRLFF
jgi:hypothetical protein